MALSVGMCKICASLCTNLVEVAVFVGTSQTWIPDLVERAKKLKINGGFEKGTDLCDIFLLSVRDTHPILYPVGRLFLQRPKPAS